jgi:hypothetical protein
MLVSFYRKRICLAKIAKTLYLTVRTFVDRNIKDSKIINKFAN